ncbi:MAG: hypothetical protein RTU30_14140 [Candidatus Thorarchaeota archaeon]
MKFRERWRIAGVVSSEIRFQGYLDANPMSRSRIKEDPDKIVRQIKNSSRFSGGLTGFLIVMLAIISIAAAYFDEDIGPLHLRLSLSISLFLALTFVLVFFLNLMSTSGFFGAEGMKLLTILPFSRPDLENMILLSFWRIFITPSIIINTVYPLICLFVFGPITAILVLASCLITTSLSIGALIKVSKWFYVKSHTSSDSKLSSIVRITAGLGAVIGMFATYSIIGVLPYMVEFFVGFGENVVALLSLLFPFSLGTMSSAAIAGTNMPIITIVVGTLASTFYGVLAILSYRYSGSTLRSVSVGAVTTSTEQIQRDISVEVVSPISAIIRKDVKLATRNLGSIMIIVMPVLMIFSAYPIVMLTTEGLFRSTSALVGMGYITSFTGLSFIGLLSLDSEGASLHEGLPIDSKMILSAKVRLFAIQFTLAMSVLVVWFALSNPITPLIILIPIVHLPCSYSIGNLVGAIIYRIRGGGRVVAVNISGDQIIVATAMALSVLVSSVPLIAYAMTILALNSPFEHIIALGVQLAVVFLEMLAVRGIVPRLLKG